MSCCLSAAQASPRLPDCHSEPPQPDPWSRPNRRICCPDLAWRGTAAAASAQRRCGEGCTLAVDTTAPSLQEWSSGPTKTTIDSQHIGSDERLTTAKHNINTPIRSCRGSCQRRRNSVAPYNLSAVRRSSRDAKATRSSGYFENWKSDEHQSRHPRHLRPLFKTRKRLKRNHKPRLHAGCCNLLDR